VLASLVALTAAAAAAPAPREPRPAGHTERVEHRDPSTPPARGPASALVTIEVFVVPGPSMPINVLNMLQQLQERHPARIRLVYRIVKSGALLMVPTAALEAQAEGKFFEMMAELAKQRMAPTMLKKEDLVEIARKIGVDPQRMLLATQVEQYIDLLDANQRRVERLHAANIPSVVFNARPTRVTLGSLSPADLDREYEVAYDRALDKLDRGYSVDQLAQAFDDDAMQGAPPVVVSGSARDDDDRSSLDHPLANPPLPLAGLPSHGKPGIAAIVPIIVLCRPNDGGCSQLLRAVDSGVRLYPDEVRIVWAPWFDVGRDDAADLTLLGDAALCAEAIGSNRGELTTSPGWLWQQELYAQVARTAGRKLAADSLINAVAAQLHVDDRALSACRARMAGTTLDWIAAARHAGVPRSNTAVVIGGRIYDGLTDQTLVQALVEAELAPGVLGSLPRWHPGK
jgi:hypothetical protein